MLTLALRLGKTLNEISDQVSAEELFLWQAFDRESPLGDQRGDVLAAIIAAASFQAQGAKVSALDLMPVWAGERIEVDEQEEGEDLLKNYLTERAGIQQKR